MWIMSTLQDLARLVKVPCGLALAARQLGSARKVTSGSVLHRFCISFSYQGLPFINRMLGEEAHQSYKRGPSTTLVGHSMSLIIAGR